MTDPVLSRHGLPSSEIGPPVLKSVDSIDFGLWLNDLDIDLQRRLAEYTMSSIFYQLHRPPLEVITSKSIDEILKSCHREWCFIQSPGHIIESPEQQFLKLLAPYLRDNLLLAGHILADDHYYYMHEQCLLINVSLWKRLGKPFFGGKSERAVKVHAARRSPGNIHDDYTPLYLAADKGKIEISRTRPGWNMISASMEHNYEVLNWNLEFRKKKFYFYPFLKNQREMAAYLTNTRRMENLVEKHVRRVSEYLKKTIMPKKEQFFISNTEHDRDFLRLQRNGPIDLLMGTPSGFKLNRLLHWLGMRPETRIVYFDSQDIALRFKKYLIARWDGRNLGRACADFMQGAGDNAAPFMFRPDTPGFRERINESFEEQVIRFFSSEKAWLYHWNTFKQLRIDFVHCDLTSEYEKLTAYFIPGKKAALWFTNIFDFNPFVYTYEYAEREKRYKDFLAAVEEKDPDAMLIGSAPRRWYRF